ncbi:hypothetical protein OG754_00375 [Streptomyces decoyicus]|uniref:hypothetical protein n=1 Tax=Streptomyces decoyicus TaxID=249567 RepID=UPI002E2FA991|nr:hypothetical protein [Streptomyces decoyicus]
MRRRILRAVVVAVVCAVLLFAVPLAVATLRLFQQDEVRELQQLADRLAVTVPAPTRDHTWSRPDGSGPYGSPLACVRTSISARRPAR